jgi:chemotaxis protein MotB
MAETPIIVIRRRKQHAAHHGGAWKVAYADFVTAMMALFIVLWLLSSSEQVQKAVGGYFSDPTGPGKDIGNGLRGVGGESLSVSKDDIPKLKQKLEQAITETASLKKIKEHVIMAITGEGLRIELSEGKQASFFFESGSPAPTGYGKEILSVLAAEIGKMPNKVIIEGHTDSSSFGGRKDYSNWELSAERANAARRLMQDSGIRPDQIAQVRGYADQKLRNAADPNDPSNRRITLIIQSVPVPEIAKITAKVTAAETGSPEKPPKDQPAGGARAAGSPKKP